MKLCSSDNHYSTVPQNIIKKINEDCKKRLAKDIKIYLKEKIGNNMVANVTKISQKMKSKSFLGIDKNIIEQETMSFFNYKV